MNNQRNFEGLVFTRVKPGEFQEVTDLLNAAYRWVDLSSGKIQSEELEVQDSTVAEASYFRPQRHMILYNQGNAWQRMIGVVSSTNQSTVSDWMWTNNKT